MQRGIEDHDRIASARTGVWMAQRQAALEAAELNAAARAQEAPKAIGNVAINPGVLIGEESAAWEGRALAQIGLGVEVSAPPATVSSESLTAMARLAFTGDTEHGAQVAA
jgi:hypothetical protein